MSDYTKTTDFDVKDSLPSGDTGKIIRGSEFEVEFENIEVAIASKADSLNTVLTGNTSATNLSVTGNTTLGNAATDTVTVNADFSSDLLPSADATYDLGAVGSEWQDLYITGTANIDDLSCGTASFSGDLAVDTDTLFVDVSESTVGIGTNNPDQLLHIAGSTNPTIVIEDSDASTLTAASGAVEFQRSSNVAFGGLYNIGSSTELKLATKFVGGEITFSPGNDTERMRIDGSGNVGIGTNDPQTLLHIAQDNPLLRFEDTAGGTPYTFDVGSDAGLFKVINTTSTTTPFVIEGSTGDVGIGTTNPAADLEVSSDANTKVRISDSTNVNQRFEISHNAGFTALTAGNNAAKGVLAFYQYDGTDTTEAMRLDASGNLNTSFDVTVGIGSTSSLFIKKAFDTTAALKFQRTTAGTPVDASVSCDANENLVFDWNLDGLNAACLFKSNSTERFRIENSGKVGIGVTTALGGILTLPHQESLSFHDAGGSARKVLEFDTGELKHGSAGAGLSTQTFFTGGTERLRIDSSGNVGIGDTTPSRKLSVRDVTATPFISIVGSQSSIPGLLFGDADSDSIGQIRYDNTDNSMAFTTSNTQKMAITASGNLLVGTQAANTSSAGHILYPTGENYLLADGTSSNQQVRFYRNVDATAALVGSIATTGTATAYNTSSDVRLKENITDAPEGNVDALQVRSFDWKADGSHQEYGFIAQELEAVAPYAVTKGETEDNMWGVDYSKLVPMLVKEIQDLKAEVAALKEAN